MPKTNDGRISTLEADVRNISKGINKIDSYLENSVSRHTEIISRLTLIESMQHDFRDYQKSCDTERKNHDSRIIKVENYQNNQKRNITMLAAAFSGVFTLGIEFLKR